jgi:hypothetical protein
LRGRCGIYIIKGSEKWPGVPPISFDFLYFYLPGTGQCNLLRNWIPPTSFWRHFRVPPAFRYHLVSAAFAWYNVYCYRVGCN